MRELNPSPFLRGKTMGLIVGLKESYLKGNERLLRLVSELKNSGKSWEEIEKVVREEFKKDLSFFKPNLFTYFLLVGGALLLPLLYLWKVVFEPGSFAYFVSRLFFVICAMLALKGIVGHYVVYFLNRDRFEAELQSLKAEVEGGKNGSGRKHD